MDTVELAGLSGLRWVRRNGRGPHLEGRQEPQTSSLFRTQTAGSLQSWAGSSAFSKTSLDIWKFTVHVLLKPGLENFEHYFTSRLYLTSNVKT